MLPGFKVSVRHIYVCLRHVKVPTAKENSKLPSETFFLMILAGLVQRMNSETFVVALGISITPIPEAVPSPSFQ